MQADAITTEKASDLVPGGREFFQWILDLPWNRLGVWLAVAWFTYQLKDFFGVRGHPPLPALSQPPFAPGGIPFCLRPLSEGFYGAAQIAMGTFVLAFIGNGFVRSAQRSLPFPAPLSHGVRRRVLVLAYFTAIVSCVTLFGISTIPDIIRRACARSPAARACADPCRARMRAPRPCWRMPCSHAS
jgi:hypothetical protein